MDIFEDMRSKLNANAIQELDRFQNKYTERMKNTMYGLICHAYNQGVKEGKKETLKDYARGYQDGLNFKPEDVFKEGVKAGHTDLLDALNVIANQYSENECVLRNYIKNEKPERIIEMAAFYRNGFDDEIKPGDEVACVDRNGMLSTGNRFIVTDIEPSEFISGITLDGGTHFHSADEGSDLSRWHKTGRHVDILGFLDQFKEDSNGGQG